MRLIQRLPQNTDTSLAQLKTPNEINGGKADKSTLGVKATDDKTFVVTFAQPTPYFEFLTANSVYYPLNQKVVEKYGKQYGTSSEKMVYSGPSINLKNQRLERFKPNILNREE